MTPKKNNHGQALIEYLLVFSFMTFFSFSLVRGLSKSMYQTVGYLGSELTEQLTIGVCDRLCYTQEYEN